MNGSNALRTYMKTLPLNSPRSILPNPLPHPEKQRISKLWIFITNWPRLSAKYNIFCALYIRSEQFILILQDTTLTQVNSSVRASGMSHAVVRLGKWKRRVLYSFFRVEISWQPSTSHSWCLGLRLFHTVIYSRRHITIPTSAETLIFYYWSCAASLYPCLSVWHTHTLMTRPVFPTHRF